MPKVRDDPKLLEAIAMVSNGVAPRVAWERCGMPNGEAGIQNIRKAGKKLAATRAADLAEQEEEMQKRTAGPGKGHPAAGFRLRPDQLKSQLQMKRAAAAAWDKVYMEATEKWALLYREGKTGKGELSADGVAFSFKDAVPDGYKLTGRMLKNALAQGRSGVAQRKPGPKAAIPQEMVDVVGTYASMKQLGGDEQTPRMLGRVAKAAVAGTPFEGRLASVNQCNYFLQRVRQSTSLSTKTNCVVDDRRWQWLTSTNLLVWG